MIEFGLALQPELKFRELNQSRFFIRQLKEEQRVTRKRKSSRLSLLGIYFSVIIFYHVYLYYSYIHLSGNLTELTSYPSFKTSFKKIPYRESYDKLNSPDHDMAAYIKS